MIFLVWLHLLAAITWVGGMLFLTLVLVPVFKAESFAGERRALFVMVARRFRVVVWASILLLILTGIILVRLRFDSLLNPTGWPPILKLKLALVALLIVLTMAHDFWLGPRVARLTEDPKSGPVRETVLVRIAPWVARGGVVLALGVLLAAVMLAQS